MTSENETDRMFRERAEALALVIAAGRWRCNGTQYRDVYLDGAERFGLDKDKAIATIGIRIAIELLELHRVGLLCLEDMEVSERKARKQGWVDAHAFLERLALARQRSKAEATFAEIEQLQREVLLTEADQMDRLMREQATALAKEIGDDSIIPPPRVE